MKPIVPPALEEYCRQHSIPSDATFDAIEAYTNTHTELPQMMLGPLAGALLTVLAKSANARNALEIGTFTGYSSLAIARGLADDGQLTTVDINPETTAKAREFWGRHPDGVKISALIGPALDIVGTLVEPFDFVFIDADKGNYINYWEAVITKVRAGGLIVADNTLWSGDIIAPQDDDGHSLAAFNQHVAKDTRVDVALLTVRDGMTVACKR